MNDPISVQIAPHFAERYPDASPTATECAMNLVLTADLLVKAIAGLLQPFNLSPAAGLVLSMLADAPQPLPPNQIAERLIISRATVTGLIDSLERYGYAQRVPHASDRRMLLVTLTERGREVAARFRPIVHRHQKEWLSALDEEAQLALTAALKRVQSGLSSQPG